jgi:hypothetical protein
MRAGKRTPAGSVSHRPSATSRWILRRTVSNGMPAAAATALMLTGRRSSSGGSSSSVS